MSTALNPCCRLLYSQRLHGYFWPKLDECSMMGALKVSKKRNLQGKSSNSSRKIRSVEFAGEFDGLAHDASFDIIQIYLVDYTYRNLTAHCTFNLLGGHTTSGTWRSNQTRSPGKGCETAAFPERDERSCRKHQAKKEPNQGLCLVYGGGFLGNTSDKISKARHKRKNCPVQGR